MNGEGSEVPDYEETYRRHRLELVRLAFLMCGSRDLSEDLVQTVFTSAHPRWHTIDNHVAYLRSAVVKRAKDGQRRDIRRRGLAAPPTLQVTFIPEVDETWDLVQRLPWERRAVVVLHYYLDLQLVEVARILGRPDGTVRSNHRRALDWLREALCDEEDE
jgi:RNA polymerase sigma factor (sigma-70 family)